MKLNTEALSQVKLGTPVLAAGLYFVRAHNAEIKPNKNQTGNNLHLQFKIHGAELPLHAGGETANDGFMFFHVISLEAKNGYNPNKSLKELADAVGFTGDDIELETFLNKDLKVKVAYEPAKDSYDEKNSIKKFLPIKAEDNFNPSF